MKAVQDRAGDPDQHLARWLREGAPMGIRRPIEPSCGFFPKAPVEPTVDPDDVFSMDFHGNHPSFRFSDTGETPPGHELIEDHLNKGFGLLFASREDAETFLQSPIAPAPFGCISKQKKDHSVKHRVIMDLRRNSVNAASRVPERQVLPTVFNHARDLAELAGELLLAPPETDMCVRTMVLDFQDAFMGIPLRAEEYPFNCCVTEVPLVRTRAPKYKNEPEVGQVVLWTVLGFGGKPNPLVFSRAASLACRTGQALLRVRHKSPGSQLGAPGRLQLYVDDPVLSLAGPPASCSLSMDLVILWWLCLGLPLAWRKGTYTAGLHEWIGALFTLRPGSQDHPVAVVSVPQEFVELLSNDLSTFDKARGFATRHEVDKLLGRAGRLAYLVPAALPFVSALWGAAAATESAALAGRRGAPPGCFPVKRFRHAVRWLQILLHPPDGECWLPLEHTIDLKLQPIRLEEAPRIELDASPWGGGAILFISDVPVEYFYLQWDLATANFRHAPVGDPSGQTTWKLYIILLALMQWGYKHRVSGLAILGDNTAALDAALGTKGRKDLATIGRKISWRRARLGWHYCVGHLPSEANSWADRLSRIFSDEKICIPQELAKATLLKPPETHNLWVCS